MPIGFLYDGMWSLTDFLDIAREADTSGFDSIWIAEHFAYRDAAVSAALVLANTHKVRVIPGPISPFIKHPLAIAMAACSLAEVASGRYGLVLGTGDLTTQARSGVTVENPVVAMEEALDLIRALANGKTICKSEGFWRMDHVRLEFQNPNPFPIYLAAKRKRMLELAARKADGIVFSAGTSPSFIRTCLNNEVGPRILGKSNAGILLTSIAKHREEAYDQARSTLAYLLQTPNLQEDWDLNGLEIDHRAINSALRKQDFRLATSLISDRAVEVLCAAGTPDDFHNRLEAYRDAGIILPVIWPIGDPQNKRQILQLALQATKDI